jgi:putative ABC transport system permease protein
VLRWCDRVLRIAAPLVPDDLRRDWLREWRAEFHYKARRAEQSGRRLPLMAVARALGAIVHAAWLRWDRWRLDMIWQDFKHAVRSLKAKPGFTAVTLLTLAIGIGGTTAIFGAVNAVLLRPLPYPQPDQLIRIYAASARRADAVGYSVSPPDFADWRHDSTSFTEVAASYDDSLALTGSGEPEQIPSGRVTGGFFAVMSTPPLIGRTFTVADEAVGGRDVVVLGHSLWQRRFGSNAAVVGQTIVIDGITREVVGVMPAGFQYPLGADLWIPLRLSPRDLETQRGAHYLNVIARLKPPITIERAREDMRAIAARLARDFPKTDRDITAKVEPLRESMVGNVRRSLFVLLGAVGLVLLIVCVNIAGLVLIRALGRGRELAVRVAIGAGRATLVRSLLIESLVLGVAGGAAGLLLASWATAAIASLDPSIGVPLINQARMDTLVVGFALAVAVLASVIFGTMPAWHASSLSNIVTRIREEGGSTTSDPQRQRMRSALIVAETTLAVVLLVAAGLLARSFERLLAVDLGFSPASLQTFAISLPDSRYGQPRQRQEFIDQVVTRASTIGNVESAAAVFGLPLSNFRYGISTSTRDGVTLSDDEQDALTLQVRLVTPDYFKTMSIPILKGRGFAATDRMGSPLVIMLNATAAARVWPTADAMGHQLELGTRMGLGGARAGGTVVGIAGDVRDFGPSARAAPTIYLPHAQWPDGAMTIVAKARSGDPASLVPGLRRVLKDLDPDVPMSAVRSMDQISAIAVAQPRLYLVLIGSFALTALLLCAIGLYGVLAYAVGQRTREIGIRLALGAKRTEVLRMVMVQAGRLAVAGVGLGLIAAVLASRVLRSQLFEVAPTDVATYAAVGGGLLLVSLLASWIPARRASRIDPLTALRHD